MVVLYKASNIQRISTHRATNSTSQWSSSKILKTTVARPETTLLCVQQSLLSLNQNCSVKPAASSHLNTPLTGPDPMLVSEAEGLWQNICIWCCRNENGKHVFLFKLWAQLIALLLAKNTIQFVQYWCDSFNRKFHISCSILVVIKNTSNTVNKWLWLARHVSGQ